MLMNFHHNRSNQTTSLITTNVSMRRDALASISDNIGEADAFSYSSSPPILTETGFIIPGSARPIIEALVTSSGRFPIHQPTDIFPDATVKSDPDIPPGDIEAEVITAVDYLPADVNEAIYHTYLSPYSCMPFSSAIKANHCSTEIQNVQLANFSTSPWNIQTAWMAENDIPYSPARWASASFINIRDRARLMIANNAKIESIIGPTSLHRLLDNRVRNPDLPLNVSDWAQDFMSNFPHVSIPDKVACWAVLWKVLRWQAFQTRETFEEVPVWCRPGPSELFCPHMPIIIALAWPNLRRYFVEQASNTDWVEAVMGSISVTWPYGDDTVFQTDPSGALTMSTAFEAWINDGKNWSLSTASTKALIGIEGRARLRRD